MGKQNERGTDCGLSRLLSLSQGHTPGHPWPITIENVKQMYMRVLLSPYLPYTTPPVIFFDNYVRDARTLGQWERTHTALTGLTRLTLVRRVRLCTALRAALCGKPIVLLDIPARRCPIQRAQSCETESKATHTASQG